VEKRFRVVWPFRLELSKQKAEKETPPNNGRQLIGNRSGKTIVFNEIERQFRRQVQS
jgi:hypothetical protein